VRDGVEYACEFLAERVVVDQPAGPLAGGFPAGRVTGRIRGEGLGLAGARQVLAQHGGSLSVWRGAGAGTTRSVWLPFRAPDVGDPIENLDLEV
jgi:hypothetical protein